MRQTHTHTLTHTYTVTHARVQWPAYFAQPLWWVQEYSSESATGEGQGYGLGYIKLTPYARSAET